MAVDFTFPGLHYSRASIGSIPRTVIENEVAVATQYAPRFEVQAYCAVIDDAAETIQHWYLGPENIAEHSYPDPTPVEGLIKHPPYNYTPVFGGGEEFVAFRRFANPDVYSFRDVTTRPATWGTRINYLQPHGTLVALDTRAKVIEATVRGAPIIAQVVIADASSQTRVAMEFPVKTMNQDPPTGRWQVDTPMLFAHPAVTPTTPGDRLYLARAVFGSTEPTTAYFALEGNIPHHSGVGEVTHFLLLSVAFPATIKLIAPLFSAV